MRFSFHPDHGRGSADLHFFARRIGWLKRYPAKDGVCRLTNESGCWYKFSIVTAVWHHAAPVSHRFLWLRWRSFLHLGRGGDTGEEDWGREDSLVMCIWGGGSGLDLHAALEIFELVRRTGTSLSQPGCGGCHFLFIESRLTHVSFLVTPIPWNCPRTSPSKKELFCFDAAGLALPTLGFSVAPPITLIYTTRPRETVPSDFLVEGAISTRLVIFFCTARELPVTSLTFCLYSIGMYR